MAARRPVAAAIECRQAKPDWILIGIRDRAFNRATNNRGYGAGRRKFVMAGRACSGDRRQGRGPCS